MQADYSASTALRPLKKKAIKLLEKNPTIDLLWKWRVWMKWRAIAQLDSLIKDFEAAFVRQKGKVVWAENSEEAIHQIMTIIKADPQKIINKGFGAEINEIELVDYLKGENIPFRSLHSEERWLIESHPEMLSFHPRFPQILLQKEPNGVGNSSPAHTPSNLSDIENDTAILCASHLIASNGMVVIPDQEGYILGAASQSSHLIILVGIEKVIPSMAEWEREKYLWAASQYATPSLARYILTGGNPGKGYDGKERKITLILLDNSRTAILADPVLRDLLMDYDAIAANSEISQLLDGFTDRSSKRDYSKSNLTELILGEHNKYALWNSHDIIAKFRQFNAKNQRPSFLGSRLYKFWTNALTDAQKMDSKSMGLKKMSFSSLFSAEWKSRRSIPTFAPKTFRQLWTESQAKERK